jgi:hypothetical protein
MSGISTAVWQAAEARLSPKIDNNNQVALTISSPLFFVKLRVFSAKLRVTFL